MAQRLLFPFHKGMIICGYKTNQYKKSWGYPHYGIDISTHQGVTQQDHFIRASGEGIVAAVGNDDSLGGGIAIVYENCVGRDRTLKTLVGRYMHMPYSSILVKTGQAVHAGDILAEEGKEGTNDFHLHLEFDTDTNWPVYTPQVSQYGHKFWKKGTDSTVNPSLWLWQGDNALTVPYSFSNRAWINENIDTNLPFVPSSNTESAIIAELKAQIAVLQAQVIEKDKQITANDKQLADAKALADKLHSLLAG